MGRIWPQALRSAAGEVEQLRAEVQEATAQAEEVYSQIGAAKQEADELRDRLAAALQVRLPCMMSLER